MNFPENYYQFFANWYSHPDAALFADGISFFKGQTGRTLKLSPDIISLEKIEEMSRLSRTERYLEIGAMVSVSRILALGKAVPEILRAALAEIATLQLQSQLTLGGLICGHDHRTAAVMTALDVRYELRSSAMTAGRWVSPWYFATNETSRELLTRVRVPLDHWEYSRCKHFRASRGGGGFAALLAHIQKNILTDLRLVIAPAAPGCSLLRDHNSELFLIYKTLPLAKEDAAAFVLLWKTYLAGLDQPSARAKAQILNFADDAALGLAGQL